MKSIKHISFLVFCLLYLHAKVNASNVIEVTTGEKTLVGKNMEYFVDSTKAIGINNLSDKTFAACPSEILNLGNTTNNVWMRFSVTSKSEKEIYLEIAAPLLRELEVYEMQGNSFKVLYTGGTIKPFSERPISTENWLFDLHLNDSVPSTIYVKGNSDYPFQIPIYVSSKEKLVEDHQLHYLFWGLYMGIMVFAFIYNFFIYLSVRDRSYLYYLVYIVTSMGFYLGLEGFGFQFFWSKSPGFNPLIPILVNITNCSIILFTLRFLQIDKKQKGLYYTGIVLFVAFVLISLLNLTPAYQLALGLSQMISLLAAFYYIISGIISLKKGVPTAKYFLIGWSAFLVLVIIFILALNNVIASNFFNTHGLFIGHMMEVLLLSFALADRINLLKIENEKKQKEIIYQLEENQQLQTKVNRELEQKVTERTAEVVAQKERSEKLLLNILPEKIAEELMQTGSSVPKQFNHVSVIFTDFANFTGVSATLSPQELVAEINKNFTHIDQIIEKNGLEKIKTIGDAYLAVCGLPDEDEAHAIKVVKAAIEIRNYMQQQGNKFGIRIGVHSGQVVAGIVGVKKFAYDIWGDTVNTASRMESTGEAGKVNISSVTYELVKDKFKCTYRGKINAKGKGDLDMYFVDELNA
jgi:class 3 adenylate cyclase